MYTPARGFHSNYLIANLVKKGVDIDNDSDQLSVNIGI